MLKLGAVTLTACMGTLPCAQGIVGEVEQLLTETQTLIGWASLRAVTSHRGEALWCKITSPFMGGRGLSHSLREVQLFYSHNPLVHFPPCRLLL